MLDAKDPKRRFTCHQVLRYPRSLTKGLRMGLINEVYMNENCPVSPIASSKSKQVYLKSLSDPMRSTIGMTYPLASSIGFQMQEENVKNGKK